MIEDGQMFRAFEGQIAKMTLVSEPSGFMAPTPASIISQKLSLSLKGRINYTSTDYTFPPRRSNEGRWLKMTITAEEAQEILDKVAEPFRKESRFVHFCDAGTWELTLINTDGEEFRFAGALAPETFDEAEELSFLLRNVLMIKDYLAFDEGHGFDAKEVIYVSVVFGEYGKRYYYRTTDRRVQVGDRVVVPVRGGSERIVEVVKVETFRESEVPMPLERVKEIIGWAKDEEPMFCPLLDREIELEECLAVNEYMMDSDMEHGIEGIITKEELEAKAMTCYHCQYHDVNDYKPPEEKKSEPLFVQDDVSMEAAERELAPKKKFDWSGVKRRNLRLRLQIEDIDFQMKISNWRPMSIGRYEDEEWTDLDLTARGVCINLNRSGEVFLSYEVNELCDALGQLLAGQMSEPTELEFMEPDFRLCLKPANEEQDFIELDWNIYYGSPGGWGENHFTLVMDREDIEILHTYLQTVVRELDADDPKVLELLDRGKLLPE